MSERFYTVLGMMSGTSCDGLDLALVRIGRVEGKWVFEWLATDTIEYTHVQRDELRSIRDVSSIELLKSHYDWGSYMGEQAKSFLKSHSSIPVDFIASHGHTVFHQPQSGWTFQMGAGSAIAAMAQLPVVCDFRSTDVCYGGQGAPLVPIGDQILFNEYDFCLNLGGFANISYELNKQRLAFDICPLYIVLNQLAQRLGQPFDSNGDWARKGEVNAPLLASLNRLEYYLDSPPKSLGAEWYHEQFLSVLRGCQIPVVDMLATVTEHCAEQIALAMAGWSGKVLVTGGGAWNGFLLERVKSHAPLMDCQVPDAGLVNFKEALIFALLGVLRWELKVNALSSVTGASVNSTGGCIYYY